jgi:hypothetical protein
MEYDVVSSARTREKLPDAWEGIRFPGVYTNGND